MSSSSSSASSPSSVQIVEHAGSTTNVKTAATHDVTRSPAVHPPSPATAPTTANLNALRRRSFHLTSEKEVRQDVTAQPEDRAGLPGSSTAASSSTSATPSPHALVMDTLVRRYHATESRLERWRHGGVDGRLAHTTPGPRHPPPYQSVHPQSHGQQQHQKVTDASGSNKNTNLINSVLAHSGIARAIQSWWNRKQKTPAAAGKHTSAGSGVGHTAAAAATRENKRDNQTQITHFSWVEGRSSDGIGPSAWLHPSTSPLLARLSNSLALSSDRGAQSTQVELIDAAGHTHRGEATARVHHAEESNARDGVQLESRGFDVEAWVASTVPGEAAHQRRSAAVFGSSVPTQQGQQSGSHPELPSVSSSQLPSSASSASTGASSDDSSDDEPPQEARGGSDVSSSVAPEVTRAAAAARAAGGDDGRFTLSWIRGLHRDESPTVTATARVGEVAEDSFRSASRLLAKSRARFTRWLHRQQRRQAAKRAALSEHWRRRFSHRNVGGSRGTSSDGPSPQVTHDQFLDRAESLSFDERRSVGDGRVTSELRRTILQRPPSSWERALTSHPSASAGVCEHSLYKADLTPGAERARLRAALLDTINAATTALRKASPLTCGDSSLTATTSVHTRGDVAAVKKNRDTIAAAEALPTRAAQETRAHADALSRLGASLKLLASVRTGGDPGEQTLNEGNQLDVEVQLPARSLKHNSTILSSQHETYPKRQEPSRATRTDDKMVNVASHDEADAFRSLLVDTTHTPHDTAVRAVYEELMRDVCAAAVHEEVKAISSVRHAAADRALAQWVERQLLSELAGMKSDSSSAHGEARNEANTLMRSISRGGDDKTASRVAFKGVVAHLKSGVPVSLSGLQLDDADQRALSAVYARQDSDVTAASLETAGYTITFRQLASLGAQEWLNDQVINNYLQLLCEDVEHRQQQQQRVASGAAVATPLHSVFSMGTHFYAKVESELAPKTAAGLSASRSLSSSDALPPLSANSATLRWLRRRQHLLEPFEPARAASVRAVLIPVNIEAQHWALVVYYREDRRWVLYDSMSRSDRAQQRGRAILARLSHVWRECQRHYGHPIDDVTATPTPTSAAPPSPFERCVLVAAAYAPSSTHGETNGLSAAPLDTLQPYKSIAELHRAAKRLRHQEAQLAEEEQQRELGEGVKEADCGVAKLPRAENSYSATKLRSAPLSPHQQEQHDKAVGRASSACTMYATSLPAAMLTDTEVEWFTGGFEHIPQQRNGNDCGVFVCQVAWCVAHGVAVSFTQTDVTLLRQVIMLELLNKKLLRRYPTEHTSSSADV